MLHSENLGISRGSNGGNVTMGTGRNIKEGTFNKGETAAKGYVSVVLTL
jgi:hypothetical protein